ncbi:MAG: hypothetical protein JXX14_24070 [Deltaproteobacteria bacterium]|nr:hypothetical protein [Deltaproteobacteria bacterium]
MALLNAASHSDTLDRDYSRLSWVMVLRVAIISTLLGATVIMNQDIHEMIGASTRFLLSIIVVTYVQTIAYAIWFRTGKRLAVLGNLQFMGDALLFTALSYATGGVTSGFTFLYHLWVIVAIVSMGKRAGFIQATVSSLFIVLTGAAMGWEVIDPLDDIASGAMSVGTTAYALLVNIVSLYVVAFLVNILASRIEDAGEGLKKERAQKEELAKKLEQARHLAALGELAATLAHEIRNPLSAVSGSFQMLKTQMLKSGAETGDDERMLSSIIERELDRMGRLIDDILQYARPRAPQLYPVDLSKLCQETIHSFFTGVCHRGVAVESHLPDGCFCMGDANQLRQVLWNLLVNASQVVSDDTGRIDVTLSKNDTAVRLEISDNGPGVPMEIRDKIFDAFFSTKERGMGLGLALCQRIITGHGGAIQIEEASETGARFSVVLPATEYEQRDSDSGRTQRQNSMRG